MATRKKVVEAVEAVVEDKVIKTPQVKCDGDVIWDEIKNIPINMFGLPNQKISDHVNKLHAYNGTLLVKLNSPAVLASLDEVLNSTVDPSTHSSSRKDRYKITNNEKYTMIERASSVPDDVLSKISHLI